MLPSISRLSGAPLGELRKSNRAVIGVSTSSGGKDKSDTAGVLIESVTPGSPADKAGIKPGARISSVNGVSLRISASDADDPELQGLGQRRLLREIGKANPGDDVDLNVTTASASQNYKVKTVRPDELRPARLMPNVGTLNGHLEKRASLGASIGATGSRRDTLGIFISSVSTGGPAESAGVIEGERIAAINGVDVRVPAEDAGDAQVSAARVNRFRRELGNVAPGDRTTLRVYGGGRYRDVTVTAGAMTDGMVNGFPFDGGDGARLLSLPGLNLDEMPRIIWKSGTGKPKSGTK